MPDYAHRKTDALLSEMESKVFGIYKEAYTDLGKKLRALLDTFEDEDEARQILVRNGEMTQKDYVAWRQETMMRKGHLKDLMRNMAKDLTNYDKIAMSVVGEQLPEVYALNANYAAYRIEKDTQLDLSWTLYDRDTVERLMREEDILPVPEIDEELDEAWNRKHITSQITQGILQGEPIPDIAKRLERVTNMDYNAAVRNARTATTAAQNSGRIASYKRAEALGIELQQEWLATLDNRTRHEHRLLDGQRVNVGEKFKVNGDEIAFPGDPEAKGYLIYNCRCTLVAAIKGHDQSNVPRNSKLGDMNYADWKYALENKQDFSNGSGIFGDKKQRQIAQYNFMTNIEELSQKTRYKPVMMNGYDKSEEECIASVCGFDETEGSCASLAIAYIGQRVGYNVHDMRGGDSLDWFSNRNNRNVMFSILGANNKYVQKIGCNEIENAQLALDEMEHGKQYLLSVGKHCAIVKRTEQGYKYLELQSKIGSWSDFKETTFLDRFVCNPNDFSSASYFDIDELRKSDEFRTFLGYINT